MSLPPLSLGQAASLACLLEVTASKPGNVNRVADFEEMQFADFMASANAIAPLFDRCSELTVGALVLESVRATRQAVAKNTNLGIVLLLAPLAQVERSSPLGEQAIALVLEQIEGEEVEQFYEAIRLANPGGMGDSKKHDLRSAAPERLLDAMQEAKSRDTIALQYCSAFADVQAGWEQMEKWLSSGRGLLDSIVLCHLWFLARCGDSLIQRKRGKKEAATAQSMAAAALEMFKRSTTQGWQAVSDFDFWSRSSPGRNPGTTADLVTASLFWGLRENQIARPFQW